MSHAATGWAIKQRRLKPAAKIVLWHLCDRYNPDNGCFVSQERLANDCEMSRSALNHWLDVLEEMGLIRRVAKRNAQTKRQERTEYFFPFQEEQPENEAQEPSPDSGLGSVSGKSPKPSPDFGESRVRNPDSNLVREPVSEPVKDSRESARTSREGRPSLTFLPPDDGPREIAFQRFLKPRSEGGFPPEAIDDVERARSAWGNVPEAEWDDAVEAIPRFLHARKTTGRGILIGLEKYIRDSHWRRFPKPARSEARSNDSAMVMAYSRGAWALLARKLVERRAVDTALQWVRNGVTVPLATIPTEAEEAALFPIEVASEAFTTWSEHCERLGFALPKPDVAEFVFLPSREPPELSLRWKGYRLPNLAGIRFGTPRWWWRVYQPNAPVSELIKRARTMEGVDQIEMGPLPLAREAAAMVEVRPLTDAWESWANWFSVVHGTHLEFWAKGSIWCPTEYAPAAMSAKQAAGAAA